MKNHLRLFISYSRKDDIHAQKLVEVLRSILSVPSSEDNYVEIWRDVSIRSGQEWEQRILHELRKASIVLLLTSQHFFESDWCYKETRVAMERRLKGEAVVIPVILKSTPWWQFTTVSCLQALPKNAQPVIGAKSELSIWKEIAQGVKDEIDQIRKNGIRYPSELDNILKPFASTTPEIRKHLEYADRFWLLSRTSSGWWRDFGDLLDKILGKTTNKKTKTPNRILVLDPASEAFSITRKDFKPWPVDGTDLKQKTFEDYRRDSIEHVKSLTNCYKHSLEVRLLNTITPHVILFINPPVSRQQAEPAKLGSDDQAVAYYMLPSWDTNDYRYQAKCVVKVDFRERYHFITLYKMYEKLWDEANIMDIQQDSLNDKHLQ